MSDEEPTQQPHNDEEAYRIVKKYIDLGVRFIVGPNVYAEWLKKDISNALAKRDAEIRRLRKVAQDIGDERQNPVDPPPESVTGIREGRRQMREEAAQLVEQVAKDDDTSELGEAAADAFNKGNAHRSMLSRLADWNAIIADGVRALPDDPPTK